MNNPKIDDKDNQVWRNLKGEYHRIEGPAIKYANGSEMWCLHGKIHRLNGPAVTNISGKFWYQNNVLHRLDGPAEEWSNGEKCWFYKGKCISCSSQQEFEKLLKLKSFW